MSTRSSAPARAILPARPNRAWRLLRANFYDLQLLLWDSRFVLAGFVVLVLAGVAYLHSPPLRLGFVVALYETLKLLTFQSGLALPNDALGTLLFFVLPLLGLALVFQGALNFGRLLFDKASRREAWQVALASTYRDHVIVCGLGRVSFAVVRQLLAIGAQVVVIERDWSTEFVERVLHLRVPVVLGDAREAATLQQGGLLHARAVVAGINDDLLNIEVALTARKQRSAIRVVLRVFNEELDRNLERGLGPNSAFSASGLAAPTYAAAAVSRDVDYVLPLGDTLLGITHMRSEPHRSLLDVLQQLDERQSIRVVHQRDASGRALPRGALAQRSGGETATLIGTLPALEALRVAYARSTAPYLTRVLPLQHPNEQFNTVIVCGLGKVGYRVVRQLYRIVPRPRIVVVRLGDGGNELPQRISQLDGVETIIGDAREPDVLRAAGIDGAYTIAALTSNDLLNLQIGLAARRERPDVHVVLRVFSDGLAEKLTDMFGIHTIYSTSGLAAPTLAAAAVLGDSTSAFVAGDALFSTDPLTITADDVLAGRSVAQVYARYDAIIIGLRRAGREHVLPPFDMALAPDDEITLLATIEALAQLRDDTARR